MLNLLRKSAKSLPVKILIAMLVGSFGVWGVGDIFRFRPDNVVATVGSTDISAERYAKLLRREQNRMMREAGQAVTIDMMRLAGLDRRILGGLLRDAAYDEELSGFGLSAPDSAVAENIRQNQAFQGPGGQFSQPAYTMMLTQQGFTPVQFESLTRTLLAQQVLVDTVQAAQTPPPGAAPRIAAWQGETRAITTLTLPMALAADPGQPGEDQVKAFYDAHQAMFTEPERRAGEYLHVDAAKLMTELKPDDATLRKTYDNEVDRYTVEPSRTIDQIIYPDKPAADAAVGRLLSGDATFEQLGTDAGLDAAGLSLGEVRASDLPDAAAAVVFGSDKPGIVGPVELPGGFAVFRVREIKPGGVTPFDQVKDKIAERLAREAMGYRVPEIANQIVELRAAGKTMSEIAAETGATYGTFTGLARDGTLADGKPAEGLLATPAFLKEAFTALDLEEREMVETPEGGYFIVMVQQIDPSALQPLDAVRDRVVAGWQADARKTSLLARGKELAARLGQDASIWDIGEELKLVAKPHPAFPRYALPSDVPPALAEALFKAAVADGAAAASEDGAAVVIGQLAGIKPMEPAEVELVGSQFEKMLADGLTKDMREYYTRAIEDRHQVSLNQAALETVFRSLGATPGAGQ